MSSIENNLDFNNKNIDTQYFIRIECMNINKYDSSINDTIRHLSIDIGPIFENTDILINYTAITSSIIHNYNEYITYSDLHDTLSKISDYTEVNTTNYTIKNRVMYIEN